MADKATCKGSKAGQQPNSNVQVNNNIKYHITRCSGPRLHYFVLGIDSNPQSCIHLHDQGGAATTASPPLVNDMLPEHRLARWRLASINSSKFRKALTWVGSVTTHVTHRLHRPSRCLVTLTKRRLLLGIDSTKSVTVATSLPLIQKYWPGRNWIGVWSAASLQDLAADVRPQGFMVFNNPESRRRYGSSVAARQLAIRAAEMTQILKLMSSTMSELTLLPL
eukprot:scaffold18198_cov43-Prasinocladus_malaysianus.AAC.1